MEFIERKQLNWQLTCRICLKKSDIDMENIFGELCFSDDIVTKIIKCGGTPVDIMDGMPDKICNQCLLDLEVAYKFRSICQESYFQLNQLVNVNGGSRKLYSEFDMEDPKEELSDEQDTDYSNSTPIAEANDESESFDEMYLSEEALLVDVHENETETEDNTIGTTEEVKNIESENLPSKSLHIELDVRKGMKRNRKAANPSTTFICYCCGNIYKSQSKLSQHIKLHSADKPHECEICNKKFAQAAQLSRHMNSHTGNRPYKCKYCPSSFADPSTCIKHERIHTNDRPFKCTECGKAFSYSNVLKVHLKVHTGEKPFSCSICDKKFTQLHHKKSHERTHSSLIGTGQRAKKTDDYSMKIKV